MASLDGRTITQPTELRITDAYPEVAPVKAKAAYVGASYVKPTKIQQTFAYEIPITESGAPIYESCLNCWGGLFGALGATPLGCCFPNPYKTVQQGSVGLISRFGRYYKSVDAGLYMVNIYSETLQVVDVKLQVTDIPRQEIQTKDNVSVLLDSVVYWSIMDPYTAAFLVSDINMALMERTQTTLRQIIGTRVLQEIIEHRDTIAREIERVIHGPAKQWGIKVESILIKDLSFTPELAQDLAAAAKQQRLGESRVISAKAEVESSKLMREAADILNTPAAMQIRYLETLNTMAKSGGAKVIFMPPHEEGTTDKPRVQISGVRDLPTQMMNMEAI